LLPCLSLAKPRDLKETEALSDADLADLIVRAQRRMGQSPTTSVADAKFIAAELDIPAEHIEAALGELRADHARSALESAARKERGRQLIRLAAGAVAALVIGALGLAWSGAGSIDRARILTESRAVALGNALDRQASLVPTLVSLQAGSSERLLGLARQMSGAADLTAKRSVSRAINLALAQDLAGLPTGSSATQSPERLSLQYEIVGMQNRVSVEGRRYDDALASWHQAASSLNGKIACLLGLAKRPPRR
jgi:hypothetical protein